MSVLRACRIFVRDHYAGMLQETDSQASISLCVPGIAKCEE